MENKSRNSVAAIIFILLLLLLSGILYFNGRNTKKELGKEKEVSQALLDKNDRLKKELKVAQDEFIKSDRQINDIIKEKEKLIDENNAKIRGLISENNSGKAAKKQMKEIESQNLLLQSDINILKEQMQILSDQSLDLSSKISDLENENRILKEKNKLLSSLISNNIKITATKGKKNKLTVIASRTNQISAKLDIPASISNNINFTLVYPDGTNISSKNNPSATIKVSETKPESELYRNAAGYTDDIKTLDLNYKPKGKLKKGIYKLSIFDDANYFTSFYIDLR